MTGFGLNIVVPKRKLGHNSFNQILSVMVPNRIHFLTSLVLVPSRINLEPRYAWNRGVTSLFQNWLFSLWLNFQHMLLLVNKQEWSKVMTNNYYQQHWFNRERKSTCKGGIFFLKLYWLNQSNPFGFGLLEFCLNKLCQVWYIVVILAVSSGSSP